MDGGRFDDLTRLMAVQPSRRSLLRAVVGGFAMAVLGPTYRPSQASRRQQVLPPLAYFALGDSVASGHGLMDDGTPCHRSGLSYPYKVLAALEKRYSIRFVHHLACSGATALEPTAPSSNPQDWDEHRWLAKQVESAVEQLRDLPGDTAVLVSITIGANDFHWLSLELLPHFVESEAVFMQWLADLTDQVASALRESLSHLLGEFSNVGVVLTQYHNPVNTDSAIFHVTDVLPGGLSCHELTNPWAGCYQKTELAIHALNDALEHKVRQQLPADQKARVWVTPDLHAAFHQDGGHEGPGLGGVPLGIGLCGFMPPGRRQSWVQYPGDPRSNSLLFLGGLLPRGDCFHPNETGAQVFADAVVDAARHHLGPKIITGPEAVEQSDTSVTITWTTDQPADSIVEYGLTPTFGQSVVSAAWVTEHRVEIGGLTSAETYHYRVRSKNANGEVITRRNRTFETGSTIVRTALDSPEDVADAALQAILGDHLSALAALYGSEMAPPTSWTDVWGEGPEPDFTGCGTTAYSMESWTTEGACQPTEHSTDVDVIIYFDIAGCGDLIEGQDAPSIHSVLLRTLRAADGWALAEILGLNGNAPEFGEPCVDDPVTGGTTLPQEFLGEWSGEGTQTNPPLTWPITLSLTGGGVGEVVGTVDYPPDTCGGELVLQTVEAPTVTTLTEDITVGEGNCLDGGSFILTLLGPDQLQFTWSHPDADTVAEGVLSRVAPPPLAGFSYVLPDGLWLADDTGRVGRIVGGTIHDPAWSFDGTRLAYVRTLGSLDPNTGDIEGFQIEVANADGSEQLVAVPNRNNPYSESLGQEGYWSLGPVKWTPDGSALIYFRGFGLRGGKQLMRIDLASGTETEIVLPELLPGPFDIGPDGTLAILASPVNVSALGYHLYLRDASGQATLLLERPEALPLHTPSWSPDGGTIALGWLEESLVAVDRTSGELRWIVTGDPANSLGAPAWSPDGATIAYVTNNLDADWNTLGTIWTVSARSGTPTEHFAGAYPTWRPPSTTSTATGVLTRSAPASDAVEDPTTDADSPTSPSAVALETLLPTGADVPSYLIRLSTQSRTLDEVAQNYTDPATTVDLFTSWGWMGNSTCSYGMPDGVIATDDQINGIYVSIHQFASADGARAALDFSLTEQAAGSPVSEASAPAVGDYARALYGSMDYGNEITLLVQRGNYLFRVSASAFGIDPTLFVTELTQVVLTRV